MNAIFLGILAMASPVPTEAVDPTIVTVRNLVAAIKGDADFRAGDFVTPLTERDKAALHRLAKCQVATIEHIGFPTKNPFNYIPNPNLVGVIFHCEKVSEDSPAGITLTFTAGKISKVETHGLDRVRSD